MVLPDVPATIFEGEAELALVIGKRAANVPAAKAMEYVFGYFNFIDGSARGLPPAGNTFYQMKSRDTFATHGSVYRHRRRSERPAQSPGAALGQRHVDAELQHQRHGAQNPPLHRMGELHSSARAGRRPGVGTNHRGLNPFQDGDLVELETEPLGRLHVKIRDDLKRTWARETRLAATGEGLGGPTPQLTGKYAKA